MTDERRFRDALRRGRLGARPGCLPEATLQRLADGSLPAFEARSAAEHLDGCLRCLDAYASLRALLDPADKRPRPSAPGGLGRALAVRVPLIWSVAATAAAAIVAWVVATASLTGLAPQARPELVELSDRSDAVETVVGAVADVQDASTGSVAAHVIEIAADSGRRYTVFVWGRATSRPGDRISVEGRFSAIDGAMRGVATRLRIDAR